MANFTSKDLFCFLCDRCERFNEERINIRQFDPVVSDPVISALLCPGDVEVIQDLKMIGEELDRHDQDSWHIFFPEFGENIGEIGLQPLLRRVVLIKGFIFNTPMLRLEIWDIL